MELPHVGTNCAHPACRQLDFLPFTCDGCKRVFCAEHRVAATHDCTAEPLRDRRAILCPICQQQVPVPAGQQPDVVVDRHIRNGCPQETVSKVPKAAACARPGCKRKELVPIVCDQCRRSVCLPHRMPQDHDCQGARQQRAAAAAARAQPASSSSRRKPTRREIEQQQAEQLRQQRQRQQQAYEQTASRRAGGGSQRSQQARQQPRQPQQDRSDCRLM